MFSHARTEPMVPGYLSIFVAKNRNAQGHCISAVCFKPFPLAPWPETLPQSHHAPLIGWILIHSLFKLFSISRAGFDSDYDSSSSLLSFNMKIMAYCIYVHIYVFSPGLLLL